MSKFTVIPENTFENMQLDAGVILTDFNPENVVAPEDDSILCATTGGITASCIPTYSDLGEDIDNCAINTKELKHLDGWECKLAFTALGTDTTSIKTALGSADISGDKVTPRAEISQDDFTGSLWWVGDKASGGCVAVELKNALSTGGFSLQTTKSGKGQISCEITGHVSIEEQDAVPMVFYSLDGGTTADTDIEAEGTDTEADSDTEPDTEADTEDTETEPDTEEETEEDTETEEQVVVYVSDFDMGDTALGQMTTLIGITIYAGKIVSASEVTETDTVVGTYVTELPDDYSGAVFDMTDPSGIFDGYEWDISGLDDGEVLYCMSETVKLTGWFGETAFTGYIIEED